jgi:hypothetical protein
MSFRQIALLGVMIGGGYILGVGALWALFGIVMPFYAPGAVYAFFMGVFYLSFCYLQFGGK